MESLDLSNTFWMYYTNFSLNDFSSTDKFPKLEYNRESLVELERSAVISSLG